MPRVQRKPSKSKSPERQVMRKSISPAPAPPRVERRGSSERRAMSGDSQQTDWGYRSLNQFTAERQQKSSTSISKSQKSVEEFADSTGYAEDYKPPSSEWDSMGVLGLSSKMFSMSSSAKTSYSVSSSIQRKESLISS